MAAVIKSNDENSNIVHSYNNKGETQGQQVYGRETTTTTSTSAAISVGGCDPDNDVVYMWILPHDTVITGALQIADG